MFGGAAIGDSDVEDTFSTPNEEETCLVVDRMLPPISTFIRFHRGGSPYCQLVHSGLPANISESLCLTNMCSASAPDLFKFTELSEIFQICQVAQQRLSHDIPEH